MRESLHPWLQRLPCSLGKRRLPAAQTNVRPPRVGEPAPPEAPRALGAVSCLHARVLDLGESGLCLVLDVPDPARERYELVLADGLYPLTEEITAEVVWQEGNRIGLRWVNVPPAQRLRLRRCLEAWRRTGIPVLVRPRA